MSPPDPDRISRAMVDARWSALVRVDAGVQEIGTWDATLLRRPRLLVPIDVQALYVPAGSQERFVRLPFALTTPDGQPPEKMPEPFAEGEVRAPGVHLHWAMPDALLRGALEDVPEAAGNRLRLPPLPDRWTVQRLLVPRSGEGGPHLRGWVIEADTTRVIPLESWPQPDGGRPLGKTVPPETLSGTVGGTLHWTGVYDAVANRFAFHDPLDDLARAVPEGALGDMATYLVAGWWSNAERDPLDAVRSRASLYERLDELGWHLVIDREGGDQLEILAAQVQTQRGTVGLDTGARYPTGARGPTLGRAVERPVAGVAEYEPLISVFAEEVGQVVAAPPRLLFSTLLHGVVQGVPVAGSVPADQRPNAAATGVALGLHGDDTAAAFAADGLPDVEDRRDLERVLAAFSGQRLEELGSADGVIAVEEHEHAAGFEARPGGPGGVERLLLAGEAGPPPAGRGARSAAARASVAAPDRFEAEVLFTAGVKSALKPGTVADSRRELEIWTLARTGPPPEERARVVTRPGPRYHRPLEPVVAIRNAKRSLRHRHDGRFSPDGRLQCRWPSQVPTKVEGVVDAAGLLPSLPGGAVPPEVLTLARSALVQDPYLVRWLARQAARAGGVDETRARTRLIAEAALRFGADGSHDGTLRAVAGPAADLGYTAPLVADRLRRFSLVVGVDADPVGITAWSQPWVPLWLEWEVELAASDRLEGARLGQVDLEPPGPDWLPAEPPRSLTGRSPLHTGSATTLAAAVETWLEAETARDRDNVGEADEDTQRALADIAAAIERLDVLTASLHSLHEQLLGLPVGDYGVLSPRNGGGALDRPVPTGLPQLLVNGALTLTRARIVDAFGRTLDLPTDRSLLPARLAVEGAPGAVRLAPRLLRPARWLFRLVDPADLTAASPEATIDQVTPEAMVNPVAGFLLPDHIDEALEFFDTAGAPLGQLMHEPFGGGVLWEIAPGRPGPADAGPLFELSAGQQSLGHMAAGLIAADAQAREGQAAPLEAESALSALLRAIDTTLWTVDTFTGLGTAHIAGLVGRPIAVVRATLRLDIDDDLDELDLSADGARAAREAAYQALADRAFPVRVGELTRSDDGLLAFFVDDDYTRLRVVDRAVRDGALDGGRGRGHLAQAGSVPQVPPVRPIDHPYLVAEDELLVRPGQVVRLTLLMHPAGKVHLTSGLLPRKALQLARDWVHPGLSVIAPSARVGPVLIEPGEVRLPKISVFPKDQLWTRRNSPYTWQDDPILAATQTALLPDMPAEVQEGYIRIGPARDRGTSGGPVA